MRGFNNQQAYRWLKRAFLSSLGCYERFFADGKNNFQTTNCVIIDIKHRSIFRFSLLRLLFFLNLNYISLFFYSPGHSY